MKKTLTACIALATSLGAKANIKDIEIRDLDVKKEEVYFGVGHSSSARTLRDFNGTDLASSNSGQSENYNLILGVRRDNYGLEFDRKQVEGFSMAGAGGDTAGLGDRGLYSLKAMGYLPVYNFSDTQNIELFAGIGYAYAPNLVMGNEAKHSYAPVVSAGVQSRIHKNVSLRAAYDYYYKLNSGATDYITTDVNMGVTSFSVLFHL